MHSAVADTEFVEGNILSFFQGYKLGIVDVNMCT